MYLVRAWKYVKEKNAKLKDNSTIIGRDNSKQMTKKKWSKIENIWKTLSLPLIYSTIQTQKMQIRYLFSSVEPIRPPQYISKE